MELAYAITNYANDCASRRVTGPEVCIFIMPLMPEKKRPN